MTIPCTNHISVHSSAKFWMFMKQEDPITTSIHHIIFLVSISTITFESGKWCQTFKLIDMKMWGFVDSCTKVIGWWSRFLMFVCMYSHLYKYGRKTCLAWLLTFCTYCSVSWNLFHQKSHECSEIFLKTRVFWKREIVIIMLPLLASSQDVLFFFASISSSILAFS